MMNLRGEKAVADFIILGQDNDGNERFASRSRVYVRTPSAEWLREDHQGGSRPVAPTSDPAHWMFTHYQHQLELLERNYNVAKSNFCVKWLQDRYQADIISLKEGLSAHYVTDPIPIIAKYLNVITECPAMFPAPDVYKIIALEVDLTQMYQYNTCPDGCELWKITDVNDIAYEWEDDSWIKYDLTSGYTIDSCSRLHSILLSLRRKQILSQPAPESHDNVDDKLLDAWRELWVI